MFYYASFFMAFVAVKWEEVYQKAVTESWVIHSKSGGYYYLSITKWLEDNEK